MLLMHSLLLRIYCRSPPPNCVEVTDEESGGLFDALLEEDDQLMKMPLWSIGPSTRSQWMT